jgi:hypothetical protein
LKYNDVDSFLYEIKEEKFVKENFLFQLFKSKKYSDFSLQQFIYHINENQVSLQNEILNKKKEKDQKKLKRKRK